MDLYTKLKLPSIMHYLGERYKAKVIILHGKRTAKKAAKKAPFELLVLSPSIKERKELSIHPKGIATLQNIELQITLLPMVSSPQLIGHSLVNALVLLDTPDKIGRKLYAQALQSQ